MGVTCARKSQHRAQRCAARLNKLCMRLRHACVRRQVSREQEGLRAYAELQRKHRDAYGDNEEAREAAGKAGRGAAPGQGVALTRLGGTSPL